MSLGANLINFNRKRRASDEDQNSYHKKSTRYHFKLKSESPQPTDDEEESIYSYQEKETEYVRDTSDTSTHSWETDSEIAQIEYEVASLSEKEDPFPDDSSTSDPEDIVTMGVIAAICDSDLGLADDSDDSERSSLDSEIGRADYWTCVRCNTGNNNPLFRYCEKCFQIRKNFFPPRPKRKGVRCRKKSLNERIAQERVTELSTIDSGFASFQGSSYSFSVELETKNVDNSEKKEMPTSAFSSFSQNSEGDVTDGILPNGSTTPSRTITSNSTNTDEAKISEQTTTDVDRIGEIKNPHSTKSSNSGTNKSDSVNNSDVTEMLRKLHSNRNLPNLSENGLSSSQSSTSSVASSCLTCTVNPKNGAFVHGNILHICCCYRCAVKIWRQNRCCPICNRKVAKVLKAFYI